MAGTVGQSMAAVIAETVAIQTHKLKKKVKLSPNRPWRPIGL
jgi:hypothetical protein